MNHFSTRSIALVIAVRMVETFCSVDNFRELFFRKNDINDIINYYNY